jgi:hypothetical protein
MIGMIGLIDLIGMVSMIKMIGMIGVCECMRGDGGRQVCIFVRAGMLGWGQRVDSGDIESIVDVVVVVVVVRIDVSI